MVNKKPVLVKGLWNTDKIAAYFGVQVSTVLNWIKDDLDDPGTGLKARKINNRWKAEEDDVFAFRDMKFAERN